MVTARRREPTHASAPFGAPDGATGDLQEVEDHFVEFERSGGLASNPDDRRVRAFVGKKGVGKTTYLRRFQASASDEDSVFATAREASPPSTDDVVTISGMLGRDTIVEGWQVIWRRAVQRSIVTNLLCRRQLREHLSDEVFDHLRDDFSRLVPNRSVPRPVYEEAGEIIRSAHTKHQLDEYLKDPRWVELEHWVSEAIHDAPPIYLYIDAVDEHFQRAPMYWLQCQKGLFLEAMRIQGTDLGRRLHLVISIRDLVFSSILRGEHASKYRGSPYVRVLEWDYKAIRFFLEEKVRRLGDEFRMRPGDGGIEGWLGRASIINRALDVRESVEDYLIRHTRLIPRDIVELGNELSGEVLRSRTDGVDELPEDALRRVVRAVSRGFADEQISVCGNQIASDEIPPHGGRNRSADFYIGTDEYAEQRARVIVELLRGLGSDRFDREACHELGAAGRTELNYDHLLDVLWHNGVLGYDCTDADADHADFYSGLEAGHFHLPLDKPMYVLHPSIPHLIHMKHSGPVPVRAYRRV